MHSQQLRAATINWGNTRQMSLLSHLSIVWISPKEAPLSPPYRQKNWGSKKLRILTATNTAVGSWHFSPFLKPKQLYHNWCQPRIKQTLWLMPGTVANTCDPRIWKSEAGLPRIPCQSAWAILWVKDQSELHIETLFQKNERNQPTSQPNTVTPLCPYNERNHYNNSYQF